MTIEDRLQQLEKLSRQLEPDSSAREALRNKVVSHSEMRLEMLPTERAYIMTEEKGKGIYQYPLTEEPSDIDELLKIVYEHVDLPGLHPASGGHLAYIPGGGIYPAALGDYMADTGNHYAGVLFASPGAVRMENLLVNWMCEVVGYGEGSGGNLASGGSIANLMAIVAARDDAGVKARDFERLCIYMTEQVHHCVDKAIRIAGLAEAQVRYIGMDTHFRMDAEQLEAQMQQDKDEGLIPFLAVASAGTTDTGAVDPIRKIGEIAKHYGAWYHVDGAYGGFFVMCEEGKPLLEDMHIADSIVIDPHKGLFLPYGTGALLMKDREKLYRSHYYQAAYLRDAKSHADELSPADLSPELTKHFRGMRMWLPLKLFGLKRFRAGLSEKIWLCRYFYEKIQEVTGFEVGPYPELSVMIYRYVPEQGDANEFNRKLIQAVHEDGRVFLSSTEIDGVVWLRLAVLCFRTHKDTVDLCLQMLKENVKELS